MRLSSQVSVPAAMSAFIVMALLLHHGLLSSWNHGPTSTFPSLRCFGQGVPSLQQKLMQVSARCYWEGVLWTCSGGPQNRRPPSTARVSLVQSAVRYAVWEGGLLPYPLASQPVTPPASFWLACPLIRLMNQFLKSSLTSSLHR